jgi:hypothetical protein
LESQFFPYIFYLRVTTSRGNGGHGTQRNERRLFNARHLAYVNATHLLPGCVQTK